MYKSEVVRAKNMKGSYSSESNMSLISSYSPAHNTVQFHRRPVRLKTVVLAITCIIILALVYGLYLSDMVVVKNGDETNSGVLSTTADSESSLDEMLRNMSGDPAFNRLHYEHLQRRLPTSIIIGVRKAGTRALLGFLELHPEIVTSHQETHFFDRDENYERGLEWYRQQMPLSLPDQVTMEKTPAYFHQPLCAERIHQFNSKLRLILIVKDPVTRLISDWYQLYLKDIKEKRRTPIPFEQQVLRPDGKINDSYNGIQTSKYSTHYKRWTRLFAPSQIHVVHAEKFESDPYSELVKVEEFLRLPSYFEPNMFFYNETKGFYCKYKNGEEKCLGESKGRKHPYIEPWLIRKLRKYFDVFNRRFYRMLDYDFHWGESDDDRNEYD